MCIRDSRLGDEGSGFKNAMTILDSSRISIAAQCVGIGQGALDLAINYAKNRETFNKPITQHQAIQFMIADMAAAVHSARVVTMDAATLKDSKLPFSNEASIAKLIASEMCIDVTNKALQVHGGWRTFPVPPENGTGRFQETTTTTLPIDTTDSGGHGNDTTQTTDAPTRSLMTAMASATASMTQSCPRFTEQTSAW